MKREDFDFVVGIGSACIASQALRDAGLQFASYPFDWMSGLTFGQRIHAICNDFAGWFRAEDLEFQGNPNGFIHDSYRNRVTNALYPHDFDLGRPFAESYPIVKEKYNRRIARLYSSIQRSKRVLLVWLEDPIEDNRPDDGEILDAQRAMLSKFPSSSIEFLVIDRAKDDEGNGGLGRKQYGWRTSCGYRRKAMPGENACPWDLEVEPIVEILRNFRARDYRTWNERRTHSASELRKRYAKLGARNWVEYLWSKFQYKLCHHLRKRLIRRGIALESAR